ncbi:septin 4b isoform X10 [Siniperca chuatsi]|uniref:septin 4b isoform X10 n=1 Tax=Siniperca chuatsi TaxID=119488 RepID=UPI001CE22F09|nr:septin 4b isoform X10 [Siniperca chuatsi]
MAANSETNSDTEDQDKEYVGFATLPNQVHRKSVKKGFDFTLMVAGESGLGKSTLVNSLFLTDLYKDRKLLNAEGEEAAAFDIRFRFSLNKYLPFNISWLILKTMVCLCPLPIERITQTVEITKHTVDIEEKGVKLKLTIVDTPGFGDAVNNTECWKSVADYIDQQFEQYFRDESGLNRKNIQDNRVHCCLYFISPFGHGLRPLDVEFMKALHEKVNIVPILAKADTLTPSEVKKKKIKIREEIEQYGIKIYQFPDCDSDEDEDFKQQDTELKESIPFAVIGSNTVVEAKGKRVRGRLYPWGIVEVENSAHCDFVKLRNMLVRTHMQDLKDVTRETHYENYRAHCIQSMTRMVVKERNRNKLTRESGTDFPIPVVPAVADSETEKLIREKDEEVRHVDHELDSHQQHDHKHDSEHSSDHHEHSDPQPNAETRSDLKGDEAL